MRDSDQPDSASGPLGIPADSSDPVDFIDVEELDRVGLHSSKYHSTNLSKDQVSPPSGSFNGNVVETLEDEDLVGEVGSVHVLPRLMRYPLTKF